LETSIPLQLSQQLARSKSLLKRDASVRGLRELITGLQMYDPKQFLGKVRFQVEVAVQECVQELNRQPDVLRLFEKLAGKRIKVPYTPGNEVKLLKVLVLAYKALTGDQERRKQQAEQALLQRKLLLQQKGLACLKAGDMTRGRAAMRILAEEYGQEKGLQLKIGEVLMKFRQFSEAADILEKCVEQFPKESKAYSLLAQCYNEIHELQKMESVYIRAIKVFGRHPRTLLNLAKVYVKRNKREEAFRAAQEAWNRDRTLDEAKEIVDKFS
jgi:tetratricopeptide (TPR) repeat protein